MRYDGVRTTEIAFVTLACGGEFWVSYRMLGERFLSGKRAPLLFCVCCGLVWRQAIASYFFDENFRSCSLFRVEVYGVRFDTQPPSAGVPHGLTVVTVINNNYLLLI